MVRRKRRTRVVLDTNVFVRRFLSGRRTSANRRIVHLWLIERRLQLVVSSEIITEYLGIFKEILGMPDEVIEQWRTRFETDRRSTLVNLAKRYSASRDPDDNVFLATARAGRAQYLITNDRDLLDIPPSVQRTFP